MNNYANIMHTYFEKVYFKQRNYQNASIIRSGKGITKGFNEGQ